MTRPTRRSSAVALVAAVVAGLAAAFLVTDYARSLKDGHGAPVSVVVAAAPITGGTRMNADNLTALVTTRAIPRSYLPSGTVTAPEDLLDTVAAVDLPAGALLTAADFPGRAQAGGPGFRLRRGERAITVSAVVAPDAADPAPGRVADLLASGIGGVTTTVLVVAGAEILATGEASSFAETPTGDEPTEPEDSNGGAADDDEFATAESPPPGPPRRRVTLRLTADQAIAAVRADAFAKELRVVLRP